MVCVPAVRAEVVKVAMLGVPPFKVPVPSNVEPSKKLTVPVAVGVQATVAVNVTEPPKVDGLPDVVTVVVEEELPDCTRLRISW